MSTAPRASDPAGWGYSLANLAEILVPCLDAIAAGSVLEIGSYRGELTRELLDWAARSGARVTAVDSDPQPELLELGKQRPELELIVETSLDALPGISIPDALIIDGDHNYYTLSEELRVIEEKAPGKDLPMLMFHDVCWPHARRDTYCDPDRIPEEHRQPLAHNIGLAPSEPGIADAGLPFEWAAEREGGPRNGILTALEDFVGAREGLRLATVPAFFGFGVLWHGEAPWAEAVAAVVEPWDRNPVLERLEANRVSHLAARYELVRDLDNAREVNEKAREVNEKAREVNARQAELLRAQEGVLRAMLDSRAFTLAERLSRLRQGGEPVFSREQVRRVLGETNPE
jgi:Methyltransferase domain